VASRLVLMLSRRFLKPRKAVPSWRTKPWQVRKHVFLLAIIEEKICLFRLYFGGLAKQCNTSATVYLDLVRRGTLDLLQSGRHHSTLLTDQDSPILELANCTPMNSETGSSNLLETGGSPLDSPRSQSTAQTIRNWIKKAGRDDGKSAEGFSTDERTELRELRKEPCKDSTW
jgi:hypothetical protein